MWYAEVVSSPPQAHCPECGPATPPPSDGGRRGPTRALSRLAPEEVE